MDINLNLLPPTIKQSVKTSLMISFIQSLFLFILIISLAIAGLLMGLRFILTNTVSELSKRTSASVEEYESLTKQMRSINDFIERVNQTHNAFIDWSAVIESLGQTAPPGLRFEGITISADKTITVEGTAQTRDDVLAMEEMLKNTPHFSNVSSPLSNILQKDNPRFQFKMLFIPPEITE